MKLKTALLASAAAFAVVGGAQAADLSVAEPVEYVKACEAFGAGYYYIPGSDTCLHVFGHVEFDAGFHANSAMYDPPSPRFTRSSTWGFTTTGEVEFNAKSMTDVGILEGAVGITGTYDTSPANVAKNDDALLDYAYLKIGGLKAGHFGSTYRPGGSYVDDFGINNELRPSMGDSNHLELSFKEGSVGLALGLEDPREDFTGHLPVNYSMPLIDGNMTFGGTNWSGFVSAGYTQLGTAVGSFGTSSYGVSGVLTLNLTPMDSVMFEGSWGDPPFNGAGGVSTSGPPGNGGFGFNNGWAAFGSLRHYFSKTFRTDWDFSYGKQSGPSALQQNITAIGGDLVWLPYTGFRAKVGATWTKTGSASGVWAAQVALRRDW